MQHEAAVGLDRSADKHRQAHLVGPAAIKADLPQEAVQRQVGTVIDDHAHGALLTVVAHVNHRAGKQGILHVRHGDQEMVRKAESVHVPIMAWLTGPRHAAPAAKAARPAGKPGRIRLFPAYRISLQPCV